MAKSHLSQADSAVEVVVVVLVVAGLRVHQGVKAPVEEVVQDQVVLAPRAADFLARADFPAVVRAVLPVQADFPAVVAAALVAAVDGEVAVAAVEAGSAE